MAVPLAPLRMVAKVSNGLPHRSDQSEDVMSSTVYVVSNNGVDTEVPSKVPSSDHKEYQNVHDKQLGVHHPVSCRPSSGSPFSDLSMYAGNFSNEVEYARGSLRSPFPPELPLPQESPTAPPKTKGFVFWSLWLQSKGLILVLLSQFFGSTMNVMTRVLETNGSHGKAMHPFHILIARMSITAVASYLYMWYSNVPHPFGTREILSLLVFRAVGGFFGVFGLYYSLLYMPLSEATVLTFLAPIVACYACSFLMPNEEFSRKQQLAGIISLLGVVLIARPFSMFINSDGPLSAQTVSSNSTAPIPSSVISSVPESVDSYHHMLAVVAALCGVLGAASAFTAIRWIGQRAHPLVSVTYHSTITTSLSVVAVLAVPSLHFRLPNNLFEWSLLLGIGVAGFCQQYCLTAGLSYAPPLPPGHSTRPSGYGSRATSMVYTQMLFALFYDKVIWNSFPSLLSWAGSGLILGSAIYIAVVRDSNTTKGSNDELGSTGDVAGVLRKDLGDSDHDLEEAQGLLTEHDE